MTTKDIIVTSQTYHQTIYIKKGITKVFPYLLLPILVTSVFFLSGFFIEDNYTIATSFAAIAITFTTPKVINLSKLIEFINNDKIDSRSILEARLISLSIIALSSYIFGKLQSTIYKHAKENYLVLFIAIGTNVFHQAMFHLLEDGFNLDCYRALGIRIKEGLKENFDFNPGFLKLVIKGLPADQILKIKKEVTFQESIDQPNVLNPPVAK